MDCGFGDHPPLSGLETTNPRERIFLGGKVYYGSFLFCFGGGWGGGGGACGLSSEKECGGMAGSSVKLQLGYHGDCSHVIVSNGLLTRAAYCYNISIYIFFIILFIFGFSY